MFVYYTIFYSGAFCVSGDDTQLSEYENGISSSEREIHVLRLAGCKIWKSGLEVNRRFFLIRFKSIKNPYLIAYVCNVYGTEITCSLNILMEYSD